MDSNNTIDYNHSISMDFLKVIATILVVRQHSGSSHFLPSYTFYLAGCAVPIFFMINGAFILNRPSLNIKYTAVKIFRISRLLLLWSVPYISAAFLFRHKIKSPFTFIMDSFLQKSALANFWFLGALILIYIFLPMLYRVFHQNRRSPFIITIVLGAICCSVDFASIFLFSQGHHTIARGTPQFLRLWTWLFYFCLGGLLYKNLFIIRRKFTFKQRACFVLIMSLLAGPLQYVLSNQWYHYGSPEYVFDHIIFIIWCISIFIFFALLEPTNKFVRASANFVSVSFGVYIIHVVLIEILKLAGLFYYQLWFINMIFLLTVSAAITYCAKRIPVVKWFVTF